MRFTKKDRYGRFYTNEANCRNIHSLDGKKLEGEFFENQTLVIDGNAIDKLGQLEDIKEELGIDLVTLFKALKDGIWFKDEDGDIVNEEITYADKQCLTWVGYTLSAFGTGYPDIKEHFYYKDYGKTWALTREELETQKEN